MNELQGNQPVTDRPSGWSPAVAGATSTGTEQSLIGPTVVIRGEVSAEEDLMIMGRVEGHVDHSSTVTIHARGTVAAEIKAREVLVEGTVEGNVYGTDRVQIAETGHVKGNVYAPRVGVLEGASFKGAIDMDADAEAIERRFREKTGTTAPAKPATGGTAQTQSSTGSASGSAESAKEAQPQAGANASANENKGEQHAAQAQAGQGQAGKETGSGSDKKQGS
jgi:cytoskeletal protein CcmA (bactofilin family)